MSECAYRLFYEDHQHAIQCAIDNNVHGLTFKQIASTIYPHLKPESAYARLKSITNPEKDEKADLWEVRQICAATERFEPLFWLCDELDHARPPRRAPADRLAELVQAYNRTGEALLKLHQEIQAAGGAAQLRALAGAKT